MKKLPKIAIIVFIIIIPAITYSQEIYTVKKITFSGNDSISANTLASQMNIQDATIAERLKFWEREPVFSEKTLKEDLERLTVYYQRQGFLNPEIDYHLTKNPNKKKVTIQIDIKPGKAFHIDQVTYSINDLPENLLSGIKKKRAFNEGDRFIDEEILNHENQIREAFENLGYPFVEVEHYITLQQQKHRATIHFSINPHSKTYFGHIKLAGDSLVSENFIRKKLRFNSGQVYSEQKIKKTQERLFNTDRFKYIVIQPEKEKVQNDSIPVTIKMQELPPWSVETGAGYGTEDRLRLSVRLTKLQFLGGTRKFIFLGKRSHFLPINLETKVIQPNVFIDNMDLIINPFFIRENEESYSVDRLGGGITLQHTFSRKTSGYFMYSMERDFLTNKTDIDTLTGKARDAIHNKSGITVGISQNSTNDLFSPTKGGKIKGHLTYMGLGFQSRYHYFRAEAQINRYLEIAPKWILAGKLRMGFLQSLKDNQSTPIEDRFLIGGASSLRGWGRHQISPVNQAGNIIGGNSMLETSVELRFPIYDIFSGVLFTDIGNVWKNTFNYDMTKLNYNTGLGFRISTPIGPVRLDMATPVFNEPFRLQLFISIGHAF